MCLIRWSNKRDDKWRWFLAEKIWHSKLEAGHKGICLFVLEELKKKTEEKKTENPCSYNVDTETLQIVYLNLYKHCVFPCSIILNVKGILASRGLMCREAHVRTPHIKDKQYLPGFGFMNNLFFFFGGGWGGCKSSEIQSKTQTHANITLLQRRKYRSIPFPVVLLCDVVPNSIDLQEARVHRKH